jgi:superfamily II DNA helicase RecQ
MRAQGLMSAVPGPTSTSSRQLNRQEYLMSNFFEDRYAKVDRNLMEDGAKVDFGGGFFVTVRHFSSKKVEAVRAKKMQEMKVMGRNKQLNPEQQRDLTHHVIAHGVLVNWEGGDAPAFTPEKAIEVFKERPEFLDDVVTASTSYETFRDELVEEASGNSSASSSGDSGSGTSSKRSSNTK